MEALCPAERQGLISRLRLWTTHSPGHINSDMPCRRMSRTEILESNEQWWRKDMSIVLGIEDLIRTTTM